LIDQALEEKNDAQAEQLIEELIQIIVSYISNL
jgi:hypothetical protein